MNSTSVVAQYRWVRWGIMAAAYAILVLGFSCSTLGQASRPTVIVDDDPQVEGWITFVESPGIGRIAVHIQ